LKKSPTILFILTFIFCFSIYLSAQTDTTKAGEEIIINGKHYRALNDKKGEIVKNKIKKKTLDSNFVINNNKFKYYNNWLTFGGGKQQNLTYKRDLGFVGGLDFNFHIKQHYFQSGVMISGESFGFYNNYQLHLGYGKRFEDKDYHFAAFAGVSFSTGAQINYIDSIRYTRKPYSQPGLYIQGEVVKKITYDVGAGASLFADWNNEQSMIGLRFILYFSGTYKGKKNKTYNDY
jgi:hypothetical protein